MIEISEPQRRLVVILGWITSILSIVLLLLTILYFIHLSDVSPDHPVIESGNIYPLNEHGHFFYVTRAQKLIATGQWLFGVTFIVSAWATRKYSGSSK
jgi:hypothetical protein